MRAERTQRFVDRGHGTPRWRRGEARRCLLRPWYDGLCATLIVIVSPLASTLAACGNEAVNVLTSRDAAADVGSATDGSEPDQTLDIAVSDGAGLDGTGTIDGAADIAVQDAPRTGCLAVDASCSFAGACCSLACPLPSVPNAPRTCAAGPTCAPAGDACGSNIDCCGDRCVGGSCAGMPPGQCLPAGEPCAADSACCGGRCTAMPGAVARCALLNACRVLGEVCVTEADCCSRRCEAGGAGGRICVAPPACGIAGNACRAQSGDRCAIDSDCCGGACTSAEGVLRCSSGACGGQCAVCAEDRDCCIGRCVWDENNYRRCENPPAL